MIEESMVVDTCAKQKTNMEEEYPQNDRRPNNQFQRQPAPVKLNKDGSDMHTLSLIDLIR